jgi:hypothetical protein
MPRQPLLYVKPNANIRFPANALSERPDLAPLIGECIALWSRVEAQMAILLGAIMKAETGVASAVFLSIRNSRAQRDALTEAAQVALTGRELEMFSAIALVYQSLDGQRADLAHGIFAVSQELPDALLWIDAKDLTQHTILTWAEEDAKQEVPFPPQSDDAVKSAVFIHRKNDLIGLRDEITQFWKAVFLFGVYLRMSARFPGLNGPEEEFQRLYDLPPIHQALSRLRGK